MGRYRIRVATGDSIFAGSLNSVQLGLVGARGETELELQLRPARGQVSGRRGARPPPSPAGTRGAGEGRGPGAKRQQDLARRWDGGGARARRGWGWGARPGLGATCFSLRDGPPRSLQLLLLQMTLVSIQDDGSNGKLPRARGRGRAQLKDPRRGGCSDLTSLRAARRAPSSSRCDGAAETHRAGVRNREGRRLSLEVLTTEAPRRALSSPVPIARRAPNPHPGKNAPPPQDPAIESPDSGPTGGGVRA